MMESMTVWKKLMQLNSQDVLSKLCLYYGNFLPMEVRYHLSEWMENKITKLILIEPDNSEFVMMTKHFQNDFVAEILKHSQHMVTDDLIPTKTRLKEAAKRYQFMNSIDLFVQLSEIFKHECQLLYDFENGNYADYVSGSREIDRRIEKLKENMCLFEINEWINWKKSFSDYQEEYFLINNNSSPLNSSNNGYSSSSSHSIEVNLHLSSLTCLYDILKSLKPRLNEKLQTITNDCKALVDSIIEDYINLWKYNQQKYGNNDFNISGADVQKLQSWCNDLGKILFNLKDDYMMLHEQHSYLRNFNDDDFGNEFLFQGQIASNLLMKLIKNSIIIEQQPPQVIKTNTRFATCVRLLVADSLNNKILNAAVKASIVSEAQARCFQDTNNELSCGELVNNQVKLEFNENTHQLSANFRSMMLKNFKRIGKKSSEIVTDEKFGILFKISMILCGDQFKEYVISLPIVIIVHGSQEINALATIFWDNAFAKIGRQLFSTQETVTWKEFAEALDYKFISTTGRGLTQENLHFLAEKLFNHPIAFPVADEDHLVNWTSFCKERLSGRDFTFWDWFYAALKVTRDHLKNAFYEGKIIGFINKKKTEELLQTSPHGTFILRFSDSELGGVSIAWMNSEEENGIKKPKVLHIQPINSKELEIIHINQRLNDVDELKFLYPNIEKSEAFKINSEHYNRTDYIAFRTVMRVSVNREK